MTPIAARIGRGLPLPRSLAGNPADSEAMTPIAARSGLLLPRSLAGNPVDSEAVTPIPSSSGHGLRLPRSLAGNPADSEAVTYVAVRSGLPLLRSLAGHPADSEAVSPTTKRRVSSSSASRSSQKKHCGVDICSICHDSFLPSEMEGNISCVSCTNLFHMHCLYKWLKNHQSCPYCRTIFGDEQVLQGVQLTSEQAHLRLLEKEQDELCHINNAIEASTTQSQANFIDLTLLTNRPKDYTPIEAFNALLNLHTRALTPKNKRTEKRKIIKRLKLLGMSVPKFEKNW